MNKAAANSFFRTIFLALMSAIVSGCVHPPAITFQGTQGVIEEKVVYLRAADDSDGFQITLINELSKYGIKVIDTAYGGESRSISISPQETRTYNMSPARVGVSYAYEPLYGFGTPITMSFQGKAIDFASGQVVLTYSIERGTHGEPLQTTAKSFAKEIARLFKSATNAAEIGPR
jgi:hypothetical protein